VIAQAERGRGKTVAALAGRRIDVPEATTSRFPLARSAAVQSEIRQLLREEGVGFLICSAACGSDLLALEAALELGVRCRVVLPFDEQQFRQLSVTDRPGDWGPLYDRMVASAARTGDLVVLPGSPDDASAFSQANEVIVNSAAAAASPATAVAIIVWEGQPRGDNDATAEFQRLAHQVGMSERTVLTCSD
jgi:hypothetical protein